MAPILEALRARVLLADGGMGARLQQMPLDLARDWWGHENCSDILVLSRPDIVRDIHRGYFAAGADMVETNTFGASPVTLAEFGLAEHTHEINKRAAELAREAAGMFSDGRDRFVLGSIGPGTKLPSLGHIAYDALEAALAQQARGLIEGGVDAFLIETCQDTLQIKAAVNGAKAACATAGRAVPIFVQVTVETTGTLLVGPDIAAAATVVHALDVPLLGLNCATGPQEMAEHLRWISGNWPGLISVMPNAGLPELVDGKPHYPLSPADLATWLRRFVVEDGVNLVGGCCGTDERHIAALDAMLRDLGESRPAPVERKAVWVPSVASLYGAVALRQENAVFSIGERCNANGSKKWRELQAEGDWDVNREKYPHGGADMRKLVDQIHSMGLKAKIWWAPLAIDPDSKLLKDNPDLLLESPDGAPRFISWWNSYYMSPVYSKTIEHTKGVLKMFLSDWDYDGLKMDGQHLNCVPPDYNERHHLENPVQAFEDLPLFYKMIYETARAYKPHAVLQICPCGDAMSFYIMPWMNQAVASDPTSSWQTRLKCKTYKALLNKTAFYGDHVELSDGGDDFATQIGIGAVLGTKFTWPKDNPYVTEGHFVLTPEKEKEWRKWITIYNDKMLSRETYLGGLYDIGYDKPETHVIEKADTLFYAFYAPEWKGKIELRGLGQGNYRVHDYANNVDMGTVSASSPWLPAEFKHSLLIEVYPAR